MLKTTPWLYDESGEIKIPKDIQNLNMKYFVEDINLNLLSEVLDVSLISDAVSTKELNLIKEIRKAKANHYEVGRIIDEYSKQECYDATDINDVNEVIINLETTDVYDCKKSLDLSEKVVQHLSQIISHSNKYFNIEFFNNLSSQIRAEKIVEKVLALEFGSEYEIKVFEKNSSIRFQVKQNDNICYAVFVSGIKIFDNKFIFSNLIEKEINSNYQYLIFYIDNIYSKQPIVYRKKIMSLKSLNFEFGIISV
jgi:hypothetical protein